MAPTKKVVRLEDDRRNPTWDGRRADDLTLKELLAEFKLLKAETHEQTEKLDSITGDIKAMREILEYWRNLKGVGWALRGLAKVLLGLAAIGGAVFTAITWFKGGTPS